MNGSSSFLTWGAIGALVIAAFVGFSMFNKDVDAIVDAIDKATLTVTDHTLVQLRFEFSDTMPDPDGLTRHGVQRFKVMTTKP